MEELAQLNYQKIVKRTTICPTTPCHGSYSDVTGLGLEVECHSPTHNNSENNNIKGGKGTSLPTIGTNEPTTDPSEQTHTTRARIHEQDSFSLGNCDYFE